MASCPYIVVVNYSSTCAPRWMPPDDSPVLGVFSSSRDARRFVKEQCEEAGARDFCFIAGEVETVELKRAPSKFELFAAHHFEEMGDAAPACWRDVLEASELAEALSEAPADSSEDEEEEEEDDDACSA